MSYNERPEFTREFKRLAKKYKSLPDDLQEFKRVVAVSPLGSSKHFNVITRNEHVVIVKARFFCRYLKGSSLRIIYAYIEQRALVEFIELYPKNEKGNEDRGRIREYLEGRMQYD